MTLVAVVPNLQLQAKQFNKGNKRNGLLALLEAPAIDMQWHWSQCNRANSPMASEGPLEPS